MAELKEAMEANFGYGLQGAAAERVTEEIACGLAEHGLKSRRTRSVPFTRK